MVEHTAVRDVQANAEEHLTIDRLGHIDKSLYTTAYSDVGPWKCRCGAGPFENEAAARDHLRRGDNTESNQE